VPHRHKLAFQVEPKDVQRRGAAVLDLEGGQRRQKIGQEREREREREGDRERERQRETERGREREGPIPGD
jgi:hypothetical protein